MQGYVIHAAHDLRVETVDEPALGARDVRLALAFGGICGSDLHYYEHGRAGASVLADPMILGHELSAYVVETGSAVTDLAVGTPAVINPARACGACAPCRRGRTNLCVAMRYLGSAAHRPHTQGGLAERFVIDRAQVVPVPADADLARAALAEPYAVALHAVARAGVADQRVLITGGGTIGVLCALAAERAGARRVTVADIAPAARERVAALGDFDTLDPADGASMDARAADPSFDVAIEAAGAPAALDTALRRVVPGARIVQVGLMGAPAVDLNRLVAREIDLVGSFRFVDEFRPAVAAVLADERLGRVITARRDFGETAAVFAAAADKTRHLKVMVAAG